jgi:hypothetical protein
MTHLMRKYYWLCYEPSDEELLLAMLSSLRPKFVLARLSFRDKTILGNCKAIVQGQKFWQGDSSEPKSFDKAITSSGPKICFGGNAVVRQNFLKASSGSNILGGKAIYS